MFCAALAKMGCLRLANGEPCEVQGVSRKFNDLLNKLYNFCFCWLFTPTQSIIKERVIWKIDSAVEKVMTTFYFTRLFYYRQCARYGMS